MAHSASDEVLAFFEEWSTAASMMEAIRRRFTPETVWENVGLSRTVGAEEAVAFTEVFFKQANIARGEVVVDHIAQSGDVVLTERSDIFYDSDGKHALTIKLMGALEMDGPRILSWRDYFDTRSFTP
jgi:limonene-1,2-epoxide hydrolase